MVQNDLQKLGNVAQTNRNAEGDTPRDAAIRINQQNALRGVTGSDVRKAEQGSPNHVRVLKALHRIYTT